MSKATRTLSFLAGLVLLCLLLGITFGREKIMEGLVSLALLYLSVLVWRTKQKLWLAFFITMLLVLNPFFPPLTLSLFSIKLLYLAVLLGGGKFFYEYYNGYRKGAQFENFVCSLFKPESWVVEDRTKDWSHKLSRPVESDQNPDLILRNKKTDKRVAIECKFRTRVWSDGGVTGIVWPKEYADRYKKFAEEKKIPVYIAFGLGGNPKSPNELFLVPLERVAAYEGKIIPAQYLREFKKNPQFEVSLG
jgi:hypothetical protein